jgi:hypothetical protein
MLDDGVFAAVSPSGKCNLSIAPGRGQFRSLLACWRVMRYDGSGIFSEHARMSNGQTGSINLRIFHAIVDPVEDPRTNTTFIC